MSDDPVLVVDRRRIPKKWDAAALQKLRDLWPSGTRLKEIAVAVGVSGPGTVSIKARELGLPSRRQGRPRTADGRVSHPTVSQFLSGAVSGADSSYIHTEARKRGVEASELVARMLRCALRDRMVGAILDDDVYGSECAPIGTQH